MVTLHTFDPEILYVHLMVKYHFTCGRRKNPFWRYLQCFRSGGWIGGNEKDCRYRRNEIFDHDYLF